MNIQNLIDTQDNIIIILENNQVKYINKVFFDYFKKERIEEIIKLLSNKELDKEFKINIKNYKKHNYQFLTKITKVNNEVVITLKDITKLSAYQKSLLNSNTLLHEYKKAIDNFAIVSKTDVNGIITYVNDNFVKISGYSKKELLGQNHNIVRHPDMPKYIFKKMWDTIKKGKIWKGVIQNKKKNNETYFVQTTIIPLFDSQNKIKEFIAFRVDITDLNKAKEKAQQLAKAKSMFLANMSHEIRTPLNGIIGFIDLLRKKELPKDVTEIIKIIYESSETLMGIVNDILDISKIEIEGLILTNNRFNPKDSFKSVIELFRTRIEEKNITYKINLDINECIIADEHRLKQVLSNLIGNAIKFTPNGGRIDINIKTTFINENRVKYYFEVKDNGIGIPKSKQKKIFNSFSQADETTLRKFGGTGLGLAISSKIIKKMGGEIKLESEENKGSKFYFELEFEICEKSFKTRLKTLQKKFSGDILVAEDHPVNQALIKAILETKGNLKVKIAENGKIAFEMFKKEKFNLILMDINMPEIDGIETTKLILDYEKQHNLQHTPIIALTANALPGDKEKYLKQGFDSYIPKPIKNEELDMILDKYLESTFNISQIAQDMNLDKDIFQSIIKLFFENIDNDLNQLKIAIKNNNLTEIAPKAHKIAGSSGAVRFEDVRKIAKDIELNARKNKNIDYLKLFEELQNRIDKYRKIV